MENGNGRQYGARQALVNGVTTLRTVTGQFLVHAKLSKAERAFLARDLYVGDVQLIKPTVTQSAWLAVVNPTYAHWAIRQSESERPLIEKGLVPLSPPMKALPAPKTAEAKLADVVAEIGVSAALTALAALDGHVAA